MLKNKMLMMFGI